LNQLSLYVKKFSKLRAARVKGSIAPHKPVLLLSVIAGIENGFIKENKIYISAELVAQFKDYWHQLVTDPTFKANFSLPFYHLKSEGFWQLKTLAGRDILLTSSNSIKSFSHLKEVIDHASFDEALYQLLTQQQEREVLRQTLLTTYFANQTTLTQHNSLIDEIAHQILHEPAAVYKTKVVYTDEEEVYVRKAVFKKEIPRIYNYTCCISGMRIIASESIQMIDACHIVPFAVSHDDTISNGLSLCPNLHRALDRGLIAIDDNYNVLVKDFHEAAEAYSIRQFAGKPIQLPSQPAYYPSLTNLADHRKRFNFNMYTLT